MHSPGALTIDATRASAPGALPAELSVERARQLILADVSLLPPLRLLLGQAFGLVLAEAVLAAEPVPGFANSAMDGFAVRAGDTAVAPARLRVVGTVAAGAPPAGTIGCGEAMRIATGAFVPVGSDAVCMVERTRTSSDGRTVIIYEPVRSGANIRQAGEDIAAGTQVFGTGTVLGPAHIGVLASLGIQAPLVYPRPMVGVLSTGDELVGQGQLPPGKIRDSNRPALLARLEADGFGVIDLGMAGDNQVALATALRDAATRCDAIVTSGGVSVGDRDLVNVVLRKLGGASMRSLHLAVKPGKHVTVAQLGPDAIPAFGLPGNPVAAQVAYELLVRPALRAMAGHQALDRPRLTAIAEQDLPAATGGRLHVVRVTVRIGAGGRPYARLSGGQSSHHLYSMAQANALALVPAGLQVRAGQPVAVLVLNADGW